MINFALAPGIPYAAASPANARLSRRNVKNSADQTM